MRIRVATFSGSFDTKGLSYSVPKNLESIIQLYQFVLVPLKNQSELALILEIEQGEYMWDSSKLRSIDSLLSEEIFFSDDQKLLLEWLASYYITPIHTVLQLFFPKNLREKILKLTYDTIKYKQYHYNQEIENTLSPAQSQALKAIQNSTYPVTLLYGVTGSGKTHIYQELVKETIQAWDAALVLVPEIVLTSQVAREFKKVFGEEVIILTSDVSDAKKSGYWKDIRDGRAKLVIGTRSSLFYPYQNLGLIIMDEEHDESYVSDKSPRYHSKDILHFIAQLGTTKVLLASGTPSIKSMYQASKGEIGLVNLLEKYI